MFRISIFSSNQNKAWQLLARLALFALPLLLLAGLAEGQLHRIGETWGPRAVLDFQEQVPSAIYGTRLTGTHVMHYKVAAWRRFSPSLVILGSSRALQFRDFMFEPLGDQIYNAGGMVESFDSLEFIVELLEAGELPLPKNIILTLDPHWFLASSASGHHQRLNQEELNPGNNHFSIGTRKRLHAWQFVLKHPKEMFELTDTRNSMGKTFPGIGYQALTTQSGFRLDGSRKYSPAQVEKFRADPVYVDRETPPVLQRLMENRGRFGNGEDLDPESVKRILALCQKMKAMDIFVQVVIPPFAKQCTSYLDQNKEQHPWWNSFTNTLPRRLEEKGVFCMVFRDPSVLGLDDRYMWDGFHPSEVTAAHMLLSVVESSPKDSALGQLDMKPLLERIQDPRTIPLELAGY